jgi:hypothetical protein
VDEQVRYYTAKLQHEIDPWDLNEALIVGATTAIRLTVGAGAAAWLVRLFIVDGKHSASKFLTCAARHARW